MAEQRIEDDASCHVIRRLAYATASFIKKLLNALNRDSIKLECFVRTLETMILIFHLKMNCSVCCLGNRNDLSWCKKVTSSSLDHQVALVVSLIIFISKIKMVDYCYQKEVMTAHKRFIQSKLIII